MKAFLLVGLLISANSFAQDLDKKFEVEVRTLDEDIDSSLLKSSDVRVEEGLPQKPVLADQLPSPKVRDELFKKAGLESDLKGKDDLDRDIFYRKVREYKNDQLKKDYPHISQDKFNTLRKYISEK